MTIHMPVPKAPDYERMNARLHTSWSSADYSPIGIRLQIVGEWLAERADFAAGSRLLDVAAGNGNATLALARRCCDVVSTDYVGDFLAQGRRRAQAEGLDAEFRVADAQDLPFEDGSFDGVVSTFGVMFAPDQPKSAAEILRVCKPGGKIALANWTPRSFIGRLCPTIGRHMGTSPAFKAPANWGRSEWIEQHLGPDARSIEIEMKSFTFRYHSPEHYLDFFRTYYGLTRRAFDHVGTEGEKALADDILAVIDDMNVAKDGTMSVPSEYAEVIVVKA